MRLPEIKQPSQNSLAALSWISVALWALTVFVLSSVSGDRLQPLMIKIWGWDKIVHAAVFSVGAVLLSLALRSSTSLPLVRVTVFAVALISLFGRLDEWHQLYTPHRSGNDIGDWLADTLGALIGALLMHHLYVRNRATKGAPESSPAPVGD